MTDNTLTGLALITTADELAARAHDGAVRRFGTEVGEPYITHPRAVAILLRAANASETLIAAGLLHDVLEDTTVTEADLLAARIPPAVVDIVRTVTRQPKESYKTFITRVANSTHAARAVKMADIMHNLFTLDAGHSLKTRYIDALRVLTAATAREDEHG